MTDRRQLAALWRGMRPHHWVKNLAVILPVIAGHRWGDIQALTGAALAFVTFCLASSAIYLANDLTDIADDRRHPEKRLRPLASGQLSPRLAKAAVALFLLSAFALAAGLSPDVHLAVLIAIYASLALAYSVWIKTLRYADLLCLSGLYTLRVLAGGAAAGIAVSGWLIALSLCLFTSLACAKRAAELELAHKTGAVGPLRRAYRQADLRAVLALGIASATAAGAVLLAYAFDAQTAALYASPGLLPLLALGLMLWVGRIWHQVIRGRLGTDPILYALRDPVSWALTAAMAIVFAMAAV